jgi:hypothetical protein
LRDTFKASPSYRGQWLKVAFRSSTNLLTVYKNI